MPGDPFRRYQPGEPPRFSAVQWNAWTDAAKAHRDRELARVAGTPTTWRHPSIVRVTNGTGGDLARFSVVGLGDPIFTPDDSVEAFTRDVTFRAETPTIDHVGRFGILLEPCLDGRVAKAQVDGVCQVVLDHVEEWHRRADITPGDSTKLTSRPYGFAEVLWTEPGVYYGDQWAIVRLGDGYPDDGFPVLTTSTITAWNKTTKAYGSGTCRLPLLDVDAGTLEYGTVDVEILNAHPDAVPDDRITTAKWWASRLWVWSPSCSSAV
jgi:hypothetical protein